MLTGNEIIIQHSIGSIVIEPFDPDCVGPNSYDVHLGDKLMVYTDVILDAKQENRTRTIPIPETICIMRSPSFSIIHLSNFVSGSSVSMPDISMEWVRVDMLSRSISTKLTQPRIRGILQILYFFRSETVFM